MYFLDNMCANYDFLRIVQVVMNVFRIICIIVPIILILMISIDFGKSVIAGKEEDMSKNIHLVIKRIIYCIAIFFIPSIVSVTMSFLGNMGVNFATCITNSAPDKIGAYKKVDDNSNSGILGERAIEVVQ